MAWTDVSLSTLNTINKYEAEINQMAGTFTRNTLLLSAGALTIVTSESTEDAVATYIDGTTETLAYNDGTVWDITTGGHCVQISLEGVIYPTISGSGDAYDTDGLTYIDISESDVAWSTDIVQTTWQNKIVIAKQLIGDEIKKELAIKFYRDSDVETGNVLDYVSNTSALNTASDYLTLHLIYIDLYATQPTEAYKEKADYYFQRYKESLAKAMFQLTITVNGIESGIFGNYGSRLII